MSHSTDSAGDEAATTWPVRRLSPAAEVKSHGSPMEATMRRPTRSATADAPRAWADPDESGGGLEPDRSGERLDIEDLHLDRVGAGPLASAPGTPESRLDHRAIAGER